MGVLDRALEWLRPFVGTKIWDYCVVWKLGDDPSRHSRKSPNIPYFVFLIFMSFSYIEWVGCCCGGAYSDSNGIKIKDEKPEGKPQLLILQCRDTHIQHPANTKACLALSHFPPSIPLYSGVHGEAVLSTEPKWLSCTKDSDSNQSHKSDGTQVLIPVVGGLIELFSTKHLPRDQKIIAFIISQYNNTMEQDSITAKSCSNMRFNVQSHDTLPCAHYPVNNWPAPFEAKKFFPRLPFLPPVSQLNHRPTLEGSSTGSNPSNEHSISFNSGSVRVSPNVSVNGTFGEYPTDDKSNKCRNLSPKQDHLVETDKLKSKQRIEKEQYHSKNLVTERNRRRRIKDGLFALRALVPKISKMDRAAIVGDAIEYIEELHKNVKDLKAELGEMEEVERKKKNDELAIPKLNAKKGTKTSTTTADEKGKMEVQVEVHQIGTRDFFVKLLCTQKTGGFARLMEAMHSIGLQVVDANVTTHNGKVLNILKVEVNKMEVVQPKRLKDSLTQLIRKTLQQ
ncbi:hypothetical protein RHMOL_Rhmol12G0138600 [Rhododendron molle]|uniref:Uncharacterized protein n=1 Tax=Rhododendron molle TaxID=49168 RepID=A0ACC0LJ41_RHOML|nr:hypothetical protein RHMOL_Rhmol12G0138600 [Rhododendron molle]